MNVSRCLWRHVHHLIVTESTIAIVEVSVVIKANRFTALSLLIIPLKKGIMFFTPSLGLSVCLSVCLCVCLCLCLCVISFVARWLDLATWCQMWSTLLELENETLVKMIHFWITFCPKLQNLRFTPNINSMYFSSGHTTYVANFEIHG